MRRGFIYLLYWAAQAAGFPFLLLYLALRMARNRAYAHGLSERFGELPASIPATLTGGVWLHAVSVGEVLSSTGFLRRLRQEFPSTPLFVSTTTLTGRATAETKLAGLADGIFYAPLDYRFAIRRVLRRLRPALVIVMETEIWPNLYRDARLAGARLLVVNGRISDQAWPSYHRWRVFFRAALSYADMVLAQGPLAADRYRALGAPNVVDAGNLKYDFDPDSTSIAAPVEDWLARSGGAPVWVAASTTAPVVAGDPDEDDCVIAAFRELAPIRLIVAPRLPERFCEVAGKLDAAGIPFVRRTQLLAASAPPVLLLDTVGELAGVFRAADVVFMGGTLVERGGHNVLEPAAFAKPIVVGPHMENFPEIAAEFRSASAWREIAAPGELAAAVRAALGDAALGEKGRALAVLNRGATSRALDSVRRLLPLGEPRALSPWWRVAALGPLALFWRAGVWLDRAFTRPRRLRYPVISIGNLTAGGAGKTPFTLWLARALRERGWRPCVLTRGYKSGEEARLFLNHGITVAAGRNRISAAYGVDADVFLLDDGMQHWRLARDVEIVLLDGLDPFGGALLPLGRARESAVALKRASIVVATRRPLARAEFFAEFVAAVPELPDGPFGAFCGLGNPASFHRSLRTLNRPLAFFDVFPDHHVYTPHEMDTLFSRAGVLLTTEKDALNVPEPYRTRVRVVTLDLRIENAERLLDRVEALLPARATGA